MLRFLELYLSCALLLTLVKECKYQEIGIRSALAFGDHQLLWLLSVAVSAVALLGSPVALAATLIVLWLLFLILWFDALLFRLFGVEVQPALLWKYQGDLAGGFSEELRRLAAYLGRSSFSLFPPVAAAACLAAWKNEKAVPLLAPLLLFFLYRARRFLGSRLAAALLAVALLVGLVLQQLAATTTGSAASWPDLSTLGLLLLALLVVRLAAATAWLGGTQFFNASGYLDHLAPGTTWTDHPELLLREAHCRFFEPAATPAPSGHHGLLAGANVLLITLEGVARDHLPLFAALGVDTPGVKTPVLAGLAARSLVSRHHFSACPQTTNAHRAIYAAGYPDLAAFPCLDALRGSGYQLAYLSPADTHYFGLDALLAQAGFDPVFDAESFTPHAADPGRISDYVLMDQGVRRMAELFGQGGKLFVHVQTMNTHKNYRVVDGARFGRRPSKDEVYRYHNCLEEMDWILGEVLDGLRVAGALENTLVIVTADHGQAFGELGYHGHSNAVIKEEVNVPFLMSHPRLPPATLTFSSHFDILPTCLDLLGIPCPLPVFGQSMLAPRGLPSLLLYSEVVRAGAPSNCGLIDGERKYMLDQISATCREMTWDDAEARELAGDERIYVATLLHRLLAAKKLLA